MWIITALSIAGVILNIQKKRICFVIWLFTNASWCIYDFIIDRCIRPKRLNARLCRFGYFWYNPMEKQMKSCSIVYCLLLLYITIA